MSETGMRLQKVLAERGVASRRGAAALIAAGRVSVNGDITREPGRRVDPLRDHVALDGSPLPAQREVLRTIVLNKPRGYICSTRAHPGGAPTVYALLSRLTERVVPAGRLDKDSEGLVVLSNDGALIQILTHPRYNHPKSYEVTLRGTVSNAALKRLGSRLTIDGYRIRPAEVTRIETRDGDTRLRFVLREGRNRQIRRMCERVGLEVLHLRRTAIGTLTLDGLTEGAWRDLSSDELGELADDRGAAVHDRPAVRADRPTAAPRKASGPRPHKRP